MARFNTRSMEKEEERDESFLRRLSEKTEREEEDWENAIVDGVTINGEPLDGHYLKRMFD